MNAFPEDQRFVLSQCEPSISARAVPVIRLDKSRYNALFIVLFLPQKHLREITKDQHPVTLNILRKEHRKARLCPRDLTI